MEDESCDSYHDSWGVHPENHQPHHFLCLSCSTWLSVDVLVSSVEVLEAVIAGVIWHGAPPGGLGGSVLVAIVQQAARLPLHHAAVEGGADQHRLERVPREVTYYLVVVPQSIHRAPGRNVCAHELRAGSQLYRSSCWSIACKYTCPEHPMTAIKQWGPKVLNQPLKVTGGRVKGSVHRLRRECAAERLKDKNPISTLMFSVPLQW